MGQVSLDRAPFVYRPPHLASVERPFPVELRHRERGGLVNELRERMWNLDRLFILFVAGAHRGRHRRGRWRKVHALVGQAVLSARAPTKP